MLIADSWTMTIDGRGVRATGGIAVLDPATGGVLQEVPACSLVQAEEAVASAQRAQAGWSRLGEDARAQAIQQLCQAIAELQSDLATVLCREGGKPLRLARAELTQAIDAARCMSSPWQQLEHRTTGDGRRVDIALVPLGTVVLRSAFGAPVGSVLADAIAALHAGNAVIIVAAPTAPLTLLKLGEIGRAALPPGVLNVVSGGESLGPLLASHACVALHGTTAAARGLGAAIVLDDADVVAVCDQLFHQAFRDTCMGDPALRVVHVHRDLYAGAANRWADMARAMRLGHGLDDDTDMGPLQNRQAHEQAARYLARLRDDGMHFLAGGAAVAGAGCFVPPTVVDNPPRHARALIDEAPCALVALSKYSDLDDLLGEVNACSRHTAISLWSRNAEVARSVADRLVAPEVSINVALQPGSATAGVPPQTALARFTRRRVRVQRAPHGGSRLP